MTMPLVSIIIPVYNGERTIAQTLRGIFSQDFRQPFEMIVVDDGSTDATPQIVAFYPNVRYVRQENAGPAAARNAGAAQAKGTFLFFTDSDCVPHPDWLSRMMPHFSDAKVGVVMGSYGIANPDRLLAKVIHNEIIYRHRLMPQYPKVFGSYNFAVRKEVFSDVGGFNTGYRYASGEDNDLSYQILNAGYKIYFEKDALVDHHHTERLDKYLREQARHGFWRVKMYRRHPQMSRGDDYTFWKDIIEIPLALFCLALAVPAVFGVPGSAELFGLAIVFLLALQFSFGIRMTGSPGGGIYLGTVMFLRAFSRAFGFCHGLISIFPG